jgi:hypothetical protein
VMDQEDIRNCRQSQIDVSRLIFQAQPCLVQRVPEFCSHSARFTKTPGFVGPVLSIFLVHYY